MGLDAAADEIEQAVVRVLSSGYRTADIDMNGQSVLEQKRWAILSSRSWADVCEKGSI
jgi:hypothetical protein